MGNKMGRYIKLLLSLLMMLTCVSFTTALAEDEQEPSATQESEITATPVDYSENIYYSLEYNEEKTSATLTIGVDTEDDVTLDFENNGDLTDNIDASNYALNEESSNDKTYVFDVKNKGTYNFKAEVLDSDEKVLTTKDISVDANDIVSVETQEQEETTENNSEDAIMPIDEARTASVEVGSGVVITGEKNERTDCNYPHVWIVKSGSDVVSVSGTGYTAYVKGLKEGTATIKHMFCYRSHYHDGESNYGEHFVAYETFNVTVTPKTVSTKSVFVYIAKDNFSSETLSSLGVNTDKLDNNGYIPVGEIQLLDSYFENKEGSIYSDTTPLIQTDSDWNSIVASLENMNTITLNDAYKDNRGNHVSSYISEAKKALNERWNSGKTSLFYCSPYDPAKGSKAFDGTANWNLVLYFNTAEVQYVLGNKINDEYDKGKVLSTQTYVVDSNAVSPALSIPSDYKIVGYYSNEKMTTPWSAAETTVTENETVYVKAAEKRNTLIQYKAIGGGTVSLDEENFFPDDQYTITGSTATAKDKYQFVGWYSDASCSKDTLITTNAKLTPTKPDDGWSETMTYYAKFESLYSRITINCYWVGDTADEKTAIASPFYAEGEIGKTVTIKGDDYDNLFGYSVKENQTSTIVVNQDASKNIVDLYFYRLVILQANGTVDTVFKYDGAEHEVTGFTSYLAGDGKKQDLGLTFTGLSASGKGTTVGKHTVVFNKTTEQIKDTVDDSGYYKVNNAYSGQFWILNQVEIYANSVTKTYSGKAVTGTVHAIPERGTTITYRYSTDGTTWTEWSTEVPSLTNVGKINVEAKATNDNYAENTCEYTIEVTKKEVFVTADKKSKVYGEKDPELTATISGFVEGESPKITYSLSREEGEDVNEYTITPTTNTTLDNYKITCKTAVFTITKASTMTLTPELTGSKATKTYDGKALKGGAIASVTKGTKVTYSIDNEKTWSEEVPSITNVGKLNVIAKATNPNYEDATVQYTLTVTEASSSTPTPASGWDDDGPFTTDTCGNVFDRWGNKIYEAKGCNVGGYNLVQTDTKD